MQLPAQCTTHEKGAQNCAAEAGPNSGSQAAWIWVSSPHSGTQSAVRCPVCIQASILHSGMGPAFRMQTCIAVHHSQAWAIIQATRLRSGVLPAIRPVTCIQAVGRHRRVPNVGPVCCELPTGTPGTNKGTRTNTCQHEGADLVWQTYVF